MFTGIVQGMGQVESVETIRGIRCLVINLKTHADELRLGASVAVNGACLTVTQINHPCAHFDVIAETMERTNLGLLSAGDSVNIERSLRFGDEVGGHVLSGHVSGTATVREIITEDDNRTAWFEVDPSLLRYLLWKGWVALDGVSLTISDIDRQNQRIAVSLIPETLARTTMGHLSADSTVNLEIDAHIQAVVHTIQDLLSDPDLRAQILHNNSVSWQVGSQFSS